ncbi:hypothetical protein SUDANB176_05057 [Streptomyces sp. enrichment culture]
MRCPRTPSPAETLRAGSSRMCGCVRWRAVPGRGCGLFVDRILECPPWSGPGVSGVSVSRRPAIPRGVEAAPGRSGVPLVGRSPLAGPSATATDPAGAVPGRPGGVRYGTAGTGPVDTPRRPSPARRTARSTGVPLAPCGPVEPCPAPTAPSPARASPPGLAAVRSTGSGTARHPAAAAPLPEPPYREGRQSVGPGVEREPDGTIGAAVRRRGGTRHGRCTRQPTADGTRPGHGEASGPGGPRPTACVRDHLYS